MRRIQKSLKKTFYCRLSFCQFHLPACELWCRRHTEVLRKICVSWKENNNISLVGGIFVIVILGAWVSSWKTLYEALLYSVSRDYERSQQQQKCCWSLGRGAHGLCVIKINSIQTLDQLLHLYGLGWILPKIVLFSWKGHWFPVWRLSLRLKYFGNFILKFEMQVFLKQQCNNYECGNGLPTNLTFLVSSIFCTLLLCLIWNL